MTNEEFQQLMLDQLSGIKEDIAIMKSQQDENTGLIQAILHNVEVANAEISGLKLNTASNEAVKRTEKMITFMNAKVATKEDIAESRIHLIDEIDAVRSELKEGISHIETKVDILAQRNFDQEADIRQLKKAK